MIKSQAKWLLCSVVKVLFGRRSICVTGEGGLPLHFRPAEYVRLLGGVKRACARQRRQWLPLLRPGELILDVGANIGVTVQLFFSILKGRCRVYAFEPIPRNFEFLEINSQPLGPNRVTLVNSAVGNYDGEAVFAENLWHPALSRLASRVTKSGRSSLYWQQHAEIKVKMLKLDTFLQDHPDLRPTFVKLDVEGMAVAVLEGAAHMLQRYKPVITCEFHWPDERAGVTRILGEAGYQAVVFHDDGRLSLCAPDQLASRSDGNFVHPSDPRIPDLNLRPPEGELRDLPVLRTPDAK
ncbi:MAG: FkbM family methyltransferase [Phycisphaerae bacterium]